MQHYSAVKETCFQITERYGETCQWSLNHREKFAKWTPSVILTK